MNECSFTGKEIWKILLKEKIFRADIQINSLIYKQ